ncbi:MAG TPA: DinB family protein [Bryobacteraceae bacterium]|nr:DinB family protein [Bryobacteraceae bacterium]
MTTAQTITIDFDEEIKKTRSMLERVPLDDTHRGYRPHEKSMSLEKLATHVAELPGWLKMAVETEVLELKPGFKPQIAGSTAELLEIFDRSSDEGRAAVASASDEDLKKTWTFKFGDQIAFSAVRSNVIRTFVNHLIHHRGQLSVYLRLNDIAIPGMYGPSADEPWSGPR